MALEKLKLEDKMGMEDKMLYKRRSMETGEPVLEPDDDSNDGPNDDELVNLLRADSPTNVIANGTSMSYISSYTLRIPIFLSR